MTNANVENVRSVLFIVTSNWMSVLVRFLPRHRPLVSTVNKAILISPQHKRKWKA